MSAHVSSFQRDAGIQAERSNGSVRASGARWVSLGAGLLLLVLALPLVLFSAVSYYKLGFTSLSWYVPYEEFGQSLASGDIGRIYNAPLAAINTTSGFVVATMFTYTLGHTLVSIVLAMLVWLHVRLLARRTACRSRQLSASVGGAAAGMFATTAAASSTALTGCCASSLAGGMLALAGAGSIAGAWLSDAATYAQALLVIGLGLAFLIASRRQRAIPLKPAA
jgi:hypothetical protein